MKVLVIHDDASEAGGANQFRRDFSSLLRSKGVEIYLFSYRDNFFSDSTQSFVYRYNNSTKYIRHFSRNYFNPVLFFYLRRLIKRIKPDFIHLHHNDIFTSTVLSACLGQIPVLQTVHDHRIVCQTGMGKTRNGNLCTNSFGIMCYREQCLSLSTLLKEFFPKILKKIMMKKIVDSFLVPSMDLKEKMERYGLHATLLKHYIDIQGYRAISPDPGSNCLLFVGRLHEGKGIDVLLEAFKTVVKHIPSAILDVVGNDESEGKFEKLAGALRIEKSVIFHGLVPHERIPKFYHKANILVLPASWIENSPLVIIEAMASGRPAIAGNIGGIPELIRDGENGFLCNPGDSQDLSRKIIHLLKSKKQAAEMGARGRIIAEEQYSMEGHLKEFCNILVKIKGSLSPVLNQLNLV